ncbi:50S ribosome-binding GTPase [Myxococcota bacterium]|nr:50S ribosome-binding GTPase [Myxococcota bacterium]MBU1380463.1 50S ribosome-binding GTPase [Myxococcota bacterium]MBU1497532.1 50S ribosome-binding GTPase [Myxococcota bacterium]
MKRILLCGSHKTGKSTLFFQLTGTKPDEEFLNGAKRHGGKTTVDGANLEEGLEIIDTPGINSILDETPEGAIFRGLLETEKPDVIAVVADGLNFRRTLALTAQLLIFQKPVCIIRNNKKPGSDSTVDMATSTQRASIPLIDFPSETEHAEFIKELLGTKLNTPSFVYEKMPEIKWISEFRPGDEILTTFRICELSTWPETSPAIESLRKKIGQHGYFSRADLNIVDHSFSLSDFLRENPDGESAPEDSSRFSLLLQKPLTGIPFAAAVFFLMYLFVGRFGAGIVVDFIDKTLFANYVLPVFKFITDFIPWEMGRALFMDPDFGLVPTGIFLALAIVAPVLFMFYLFIGFLEESGYFPRLSVLFDRMMRPMGLNGKGIFPLIMGFSCITMALATTRMLETRKERIIASFLLMLAIPCAPLMGAMFIILGKLHYSAFIFVLAVILIQVAFTGWVANKILKGKVQPFIIELTPLQFPSALQLLKKSILRTWFFLKEALPIFILASILLFIFARIGLLNLIQEAAKPVVTDFWGLPIESVQVFIKTIIRRENGIAELSRIGAGFTSVQLIITILVMSFSIPCVNSFIMLIKEQGVKTALAIVGVVIVYSTLLGGALNLFFRLVPLYR